MPGHRQHLLLHRPHGVVAARQRSVERQWCRNCNTNAMKCSAAAWVAGAVSMIGRCVTVQRVTGHPLLPAHCPPPHLMFITFFLPRSLQSNAIR